MEKALMAETAASAMDEVIKLLRINEPLWTKSASDGRNIIDRTSYEKIFPKASQFKSTNARTESSKDSAMVTMTGMNLVDMFVDSVSANGSYFLNCKIRQYFAEKEISRTNLFDFYRINGWNFFQQLLPKQGQFK